MNVRSFMNFFHSKSVHVFFAAAAVLIILSVNIFRFCCLDKVPNGFHVDELSAGVTVQCLAQDGTDAHGKRFPLFADVHYGNPRPPTYIYSGALWVKLFGSSIASFRALSATIGVMTFVGLMVFGAMMFGWEYSLIIGVLASVSPWLWPVSRIAIEVVLAVMFICWSFVFLKMRKKTLGAVLAGLCLGAAIYSYPPMRMQLPLMFPFLMMFFYRDQRFDWRRIFLCAGVLFVTVIPLAILILHGKLMTRFNYISVFSDDFFEATGLTRSWVTSIVAIVRNFFVHFSPRFLFVFANKHYVYSSNFCGIFSWADDLCLLTGFVLLGVCIFRWIKKQKPFFDACERQFIGFCLAGWALGVIPAALTWHDVPHALRIIGAWPWVMLLFSFFLWKACRRFYALAVIFVILAGVFSGLYLKHYFTEYAKTSYWAYSGLVRDVATRLTTEQDWNKFVFWNRFQDYHARYYLMNYHGDSCKVSKEKWNAAVEYMNRMSSQ